MHIPTILAANVRKQPHLDLQHSQSSHPRTTQARNADIRSQIIFQQGLGLDPEISRILSGGALTWKFLSCFVAFFTIDRFGRRALFMFSGVGMASCMLALAIASSFPKSNFSAQVASAFFVFAFNFFIPIGFLGANFLYCTEVAPTRLRVAMSGISSANHWLWYVRFWRNVLCRMC